MFSFLLPPLTITFIDNAINARDNLLKKNKNEEGAYFSDDGFMVGVCYLLKIFSCDKKFESLNWFPSVINYYKMKQSQKQKKDKNSYGVNTLNERQINSYKEQFELLLMWPKGLSFFVLVWRLQKADNASLLILLGE